LAAAGEIASRLDGLPLAIELAAARTAVLGPKEIVDGLADRFALLTEGAGTAPARHQTLRATIQWSYQLLTPTERDLFCRLFVFPGGFSLDAAAAVAGVGVAEAAESLFSLVAKSMVNAVPSEGRMRYVLLETLRQFAGAQLGQAEIEQARRDHARFYVGLARASERRLRGPEFPEWLARLDADYDNLRSAFTYTAQEPDQCEELLQAVVAIWRFWFTRNHRRDGMSFIEPLLVNPEIQDRSLLARAYIAAAGAGSFLDADASARNAQRAVEIALEAGDTHAVALDTAELSFDSQMAGRFDVELAHRAVHLAREIDDPLVICLALFSLGLTISAEPHQARLAFEELLAVSENFGDLFFISAGHITLGSLDITEGNYKQARSHLEPVLTGSRQLGLESPPLYCLLAKVRRLEGEPQAGLELLQDAIEQGRRHDSPFEVAVATFEAGYCATAVGQYENAAKLHGFGAQELKLAGSRLSPPERSELRADLKSIAAQLGSDWKAAYKTGATLTRQQVAEMVTSLGPRRLGGIGVSGALSQS
jgi:hypothetical protein